MASTSGIPQPHLDSPRNPTLQVDFAWKKMKALVTDSESPETPLYVIDFQTIRSPCIIFKSASDQKEIGSGTLHPISINADYQLHGRKGQLKALKRWQTQYTHLSQAFSNDDSPVIMTWVSTCGFKTWDFICNDEEMNPVARFSSQAWNMKKLGKIEFMGPLAASREAQEEIIVTGITLYYCMLLRTTNILSLFGAIFSRPGPIDKDAAIKLQQDTASEYEKVGSMMSHQEVSRDKS